VIDRGEDSTHLERWALEEREGEERHELECLREDELDGGGLRCAVLAVRSEGVDRGVGGGFSRAEQGAPREGGRELSSHHSDLIKQQERMASGSRSRDETRAY
jgi:hypothetical protein